MIKIDTSNIRGDITGGITAGIVALPLALAFGVASGLGPIAGMYGAIAVGFFAALYSAALLHKFLDLQVQWLLS